MSKFESGKTYQGRSICDSNCIIRVSVARRTAKTIVTTAGKRLRVKEWYGVEQVSPWGTYSMSPVVSADPLPMHRQLRLAALLRRNASPPFALRLERACAGKH